jgi:ketosteroid isomerase-like protein
MKKLIILVSMVALTVTVNAQTSITIAEPLQVVQEFLTAYREGNREKFTSLLHPDVIWVQPGENRLSGVKKSKVELMQMGKRMAELSERTIKLIDVKYFSTNGNTISCILHWTAVQPTGNVLDVNNIDVYTVENGKIILAKIYSEDIAQENQFWGK